MTEHEKHLEWMAKHDPKLYESNREAIQWAIDEIARLRQDFNIAETRRMRLEDACENLHGNMRADNEKHTLERNQLIRITNKARSDRQEAIEAMDRIRRALSRFDATQANPGASE